MIQERWVDGNTLVRNAGGVPEGSVVGAKSIVDLVGNVKSSLDRRLVGPCLKRGASAEAVGVNSEASCQACLADSLKHASLRNRGAASDGWVRAGVVEVIHVDVSNLLGCLVKELLALVGFVGPVARLHDLVIC